LVILAVIFAFAWPPNVQAQRSDTPKVEANAAADPEKLLGKAEDGDLEAQYELAEVYRIGFPVDQDTTKAIELYNHSAEQGYAASQFRLGELYEEGEILERDLGKALGWYRKAAEQGHASAQYALAHFYHLGNGVEQDMAAAMVWYRKAALQGDQWSQLTLGDQYRIGLAVPRDLVQSTKWYRRAAEQGNTFAQYELGNAYRYGNGVNRDVSQAIAWFRLSAEAGNSPAKLALTELENGGAAADIVNAQAPEPDVSQNTGSDVLMGAWEAALASSKSVMKASETDHANLLQAESDEAPKAAPSAPESAAGPGTELAYAAEPAYSEEGEVSLLLAHAQDQVANLALTTPEGDNAYETYQLIRSLQPNNQAALDGIKQIGVKYGELAKLAAKKGSLRKANHYAAKAAILAPEHPSVLSITLPMEVAQPTTEETTLTSESLDDIKTPQRVPAERQEVAAKVQVATATPASLTPEDLIENANNLVFRPYDYLSRQVAVAGPVVHLFWDYRLVAETGQNSIVIDLDGLSQADRDKLDAAIDKVGFLGQVHAQIKGTIERQSLASFELVATELALTRIAIGKDEASDAGLGTDIGEVNPLVVPVYPGEPFVQTNAFNNGTRSGDRGGASASAANSNGEGSSGASDGESSSAGSGGSEGASGGGSSSAGSGGSGNGNGKGKGGKGGTGGKGGKGGKGGSKN
jgi:TPR repeat protein